MTNKRAKYSPVFLSIEEIISRLVGRINVFSPDTRYENNKYLMNDIIDCDLLVPNNGKNGWVGLTGHYLPCCFRGHDLLATMIVGGFETPISSWFGKPQDPSVILEAVGWIKVSDGKAYFYNGRDSYSDALKTTVSRLGVSQETLALPSPAMSMFIKMIGALASLNSKGLLTDRKDDGWAVFTMAEVFTGSHKNKKLIGFDRNAPDEG
jgi:hypothetical protein